jgi:quercetin dioxygenase-like cupin family protein
MKGKVSTAILQTVYMHVFLWVRMLCFLNVWIEPNSKGKIHSHPEEQWGVLLEGECIRIQGDEEVSVKVGDFWHTPGNVPHGIRTKSVGALVLDIFSPPRHEYKKTGIGFGQTNEE